MGKDTELEAAMVAEIDDLLGTSNAQDPAAVEEPVGEVEPPVEEPAPEPEPVEDAVESEPEPEPAVEPTQETAPAPTALDEAGITAMRNAMAEMAKRIKDSSTPKGAPNAPVVPAQMEFIDEATYDKVFQDRGALNAVLSMVYHKALEGAMQSLPMVLGPQVAQHVAMATAATNFFAVNTDLDPYRPLVSLVAAEVEAANPDMDYTQLFGEIERQVRARLAMPRRAGAAPVVSQPPVAADPRPARRAPAMAPGTMGSRNAPRPVALEGQAREIAELLD